MTIKVQAIATGQDYVTVGWFAGLQRNGSIKVEVGATENRVVIAELTALRYLLWEGLAFNRRPISGKGIRVRLPELTLKSIQGFKCDAVQLASQFLSSWLVDVDIQAGGIDIDGIELQETEQSITPYDVAQPCFDTPVLGKIAISKHALERYLERSSNGSPKLPWFSLFKQLSSDRLSRVKLPEEVRFQKLLKHGNDNVQVWRHSTGNLYFKVLPKGEYSLVVTVFSKLSSSNQGEAA